MHITVLGAGAFGSALGQVLQSNHHIVTFYDPLKYPDVTLSQALTTAEAIVMAAPSNVVPALLSQLPADTPLINASKGFLSLTPFQSFQQFSIVSGGAFASEIIAQKPTVLTATSTLAAKLFLTSWLAIQYSPDVHGVLLCGALKNIYAIGAGLRQLTAETATFNQYIADCLAELRLILEANHCDPLTAHLACGRDDLILTCASAESRNYRYGQALSQDPTLTPAQVTETTEGLSAIQAIPQTADFILPAHTTIISQIIEKVNHI